MFLVSLTVFFSELSALSAASCRFTMAFTAASVDWLSSAISSALLFWALAIPLKAIFSSGCAARTACAASVDLFASSTIALFDSAAALASIF